MISWFRTAGLRLLLALGLGFSLWVYVWFRENPNDTIPYQSVPVEIENLTPGLVIVDRNGLPTNARIDVTVTAEGIQSTLQNLRQSDVRAFADLTGLTPGEYQVPVNVTTTRSGFARINFSADPSLLPFRIEQQITSTVPLTVEVTGSVPFSFERRAAQVTSGGQAISEAEITGPQNRIEQVSMVRATANVNQLTANYNSPRTLEAVDEAGNIVTGVTITPSTVDVLVPVVSSVGIKRVPVVPQITGRPATGRYVSDIAVLPEFITLTGSSGSLDQVESISTQAFDLGGAGGVISRTVGLQIPPGTSVLDTEPSTVTVTVTSQLVTQPFQVSLPAAILPINIGPGLLATVNPTQVQLQLSGSSSAINALGSTTLQGTVDLTGLGAGTYNFTPAIALPDGVTLVNEPRVAVTLREQATATPSEAPTNTTNPTNTPADATPAAPPAETAVPTEAPPPAETPAATNPVPTAATNSAEPPTPEPATPEPATAAP